jgi:hypothetical protein
MLLLITSIAAVLITTVQGWRGSRTSDGLTSRRQRKQRTILVVTSFIAITTAIVGGVPWFADHIDNPPCVMMYLQERHVDHCTVDSLIVFPTRQLRDLHLTFQLDQAIKSHMIRNDFVRNGNFGIHSDFHTTPDCQIVTPSAESQRQLMFALSADSRAVVIDGHDLSAYNAQGISITAYSDQRIAAKASVTGEGTYDKADHEVKARILMFEEPHQTVEIHK